MFVIVFNIWHGGYLILLVCGDLTHKESKFLYKEEPNINLGKKV